MSRSQKLEPSQLSESVANNLRAMGYKASAACFTRSKTGEVVDGVNINGLGQVDAFIDLSDNGAAPRFFTKGNLQPGYAPAILDADGVPVRERIDIKGKLEWSTKRGTPLDAEALKRKNTQISIKAKRELTGPAVLAVIQELKDIDPGKLIEGFGLRKYERHSKAEATAEDRTGADDNTDYDAHTDGSDPYDDFIADTAAARPGIASGV